MQEPKSQERGHSDLNQGPTGLQPGALPLSYIPSCARVGSPDNLTWVKVQKRKQKRSVRKGIRTPALIRGPEFSLVSYLETRHEP